MNIYAIKDKAEKNVMKKKIEMDELEHFFTDMFLLDPLIEIYFKLVDYK
jgi:hypothetical protein